MNIHDYLIDQTGLDWPTLLEEWHRLLPSEFTVWLLTRAGDLFITFPDGSIHMLDVGVGTLEQMASSRDDFCNKIDQPGVSENWLMIPVIDDLVSAGVPLARGECYSYRQLPILGGKYTAENRMPLPIHEHFGALGSLHRQMADLPDGTQVVIKVKRGD